MVNITDEDINILSSQGNVDRSLASELLTLNDGDIVESLVMLQTKDFDIEKIKKQKQEFQEEETDDFDVDTSNQKNLTRYREIVDSKDEIYNQKKKEKEEREQRIKEGKEEEETNFSIEDLYKLKRGKNTFNSIQVL